LKLYRERNLLGDKVMVYGRQNYTKNAVFLDVTPSASCNNRRFEERIASIINLTRIGELGTTLAVTSNRSMLRRHTNSYLPEDWGDAFLRNIVLKESQGVTSPKTEFLILTAVKTSNLTLKSNVYPRQIKWWQVSVWTHNVSVCVRVSASQRLCLAHTGAICSWGPRRFSPAQFRAVATLYHLSTELGQASVAADRARQLYAQCGTDM
jgi:hypothetical protein